MQNDKSKFKNEFKKRLYTFTLKLIEFIDKLPNDNVSRRLGAGQVLSVITLKANRRAARKIT